MSDHPIESMMNTTMEKIRTMVDASTMIGDPITTPDGTVIIPVSKVSYGFASGGSDFVSKNAANKDLFGGGAGAGITLTPVAFLAIHDGDVKLLQVDPFNSTADRVVGMVPDVVDKISGLFPKKKKDTKSGEPAPKESEPELDIDLSDPLV